VTDEEFDAFLQQAVDELGQKQARLQSGYGIGGYAAFWFDQKSGTLEFRDDDARPRLVATIVPLGSHSTKSDTWMWAWANQSILPALRSLAEPLKDLGRRTGVAFLAEPSFGVTEGMPWDLTALGVQHLGALGAYRAPSKDRDVYFAIVSLKRMGP
jgi:hypothetical protein